MQKSVNRENVNLNCQRVHLITRHGCQKGVGNGPIAIRESILSNGGYLNLFIFFVCGILNSHGEMRKILRRYGKFCGKKVMGKNGEFWGVVENFVERWWRQPVQWAWVKSSNNRKSLEGLGSRMIRIVFLFLEGWYVWGFG
jgi:hypothetical protein